MNSFPSDLLHNTSMFIFHKNNISVTPGEGLAGEHLKETFLFGV
jgi:hypothetical protein